MMLKNIDCGVLTKENVGQNVVLNGWVQGWRDFGGILFIDRVSETFPQRFYRVSAPK